MMERRVDISRVQRATADGARSFVNDIRSKVKEKIGGALRFGFKTWSDFEKAVAKARLNDYRRRYGRSGFRPNRCENRRPVERAQRIGSPAWYAWQNEK